MVETTETKTLHLRVKDIQLENASEINPYFPVIITPYNKKFYDQPNFNKYFIEALIKVKTNENSWIFPSIKLQISKPVIKIEDRMLDMMMTTFNSLKTEMKEAENKLP
mmetsp:Transcript_23551/g.20457  ORF Transcript_23551/g.20457 Transcript_23551/m.20457 type:complete len:108 (-) Transcript_23551:294-617(-)